MFQYAFGQTLATNKGIPIYFDTSWFHEDHGPNITARSLELHYFDSFRERKNLFLKSTRPRFPFENPLFRLPIKLTGISRIFDVPTYFQSDAFFFDKSIYQISTPINFVGYWQSYRYFEPYQNFVRNLFKISTPLPPQFGKYLEDIRASNAVAVHIRRGDYISNSSAAAHHGTCDHSYYRKAIELLRSEIPDARFFFFSDDLYWVSATFREIGNASFVAQYFNKPAWIDLFLMSQCRHFIIANSSYSWWPAFLGSNSQSRVFAPKKWLADPQIDTSDLIPPTWKTL